MMNTQIVPLYELLHLQHPDLGFDWYSLTGREIRVHFKRNSRVFDSDTMNICPIANLNVGRDRAPKNAQSTY